VGGGTGHEGQPLDLSQARVRMQVCFSVCVGICLLYL
jgi:hypothetical protein